MFSASFFLEVWKRKQAELEYDWDVADFEQEEVTAQLFISYYYVVVPSL